MFIYLKIEREGEIIPSMINTDTIKRFEINNERIKLIYKELDPVDGCEIHDNIANTLPQIEEKLKKLNLIL